MGYWKSENEMKSNVMEHRGYTGSVEFSLEDGVLMGKILFINDLVNYEAESLAELQRSFREAVDHYLDTCDEQGIAPDRPCSGTFNVRVSPELHRKALTEAARRGIGLNEFVRIALDHETSDTPRVEIHNHQHDHVHTHTTEVRFEAAASYKETTKWKHQGSEAAWQH
jgi:predicted HicB family RNase H-like nuclease